MTSKLIFLILLTVTLKYSMSITIDQAYTDCSGKKARCYDMPHSCLASKNCEALTYEKPTGSGADFQVFWKWNSTSKDHWIGSAISTDVSMGNDSATICSISTSNAVQARQAITVAGFTPEEYGIKLLGTVTGINNQQGSYTNGYVTCSWSRVADTTVNNIHFNIVSTKYYVFMAHGPLVGDAPQGHGDNYWYSLNMELLANVTIA